MNLTDPEHIAAVRQALADGLTECWLVVPGVPSPSSAGGVRPLNPPADWVALTGACETCGGTKLARNRKGITWEEIERGCPDCIDGRKRATLTVACGPCRGTAHVPTDLAQGRFVHCEACAEQPGARMTPHTVIPWDGDAYCTRCDGNPATVELPSGMAGNTPVVELVCFDCADKEDA